MCSRTAALLVLALSLNLLPGPVAAAKIEGIVRGGSTGAIAGALVTLTSEDGIYAETVYSDANGAFRLTTEQSGFLALRVRKPYFADAIHDLEVRAAQTSRQDIRLRPLVSDKDISDQLTASAHYARIRFEDPRELGFFQIECLTCHQLGNAYTRAPRTPDRWRAIVTRMLGFYGITDAQRIDRYAKRLEQAFDGARLTIRREHPVDPARYGARITQWKLPGAAIADCGCGGCAAPMLSSSSSETPCCQTAFGPALYPEFPLIALFKFAGPLLLSSYSQPQPGEKVLSFHANMARHGISITHSGAVGLGTYPPGIPLLSEPAIRNGLIFNMKFADADGNLIAFGSELEVFPEGQSPAVEQEVRWQTGWAVVVPGRDMIFLDQIEHSGGLGSQVIQKTEQSGKNWVGDWWITITVGPLENGRGRIVGGTGEFVEIDHLTRSTVDGRMELDLELRLFIK